MNRFFTSLLASLAFISVVGQEKTTTYLNDPAGIPTDLIITLKHIRADVSFKPEENLVIAKTEFTFTPNRYKTDSIVFNAPEFKVNSILISGKDIALTSASIRLEIQGFEPCDLSSFVPS